MYFIIRVKRAWIDTVNFMGWQFKPMEIARTVLIWILTMGIVYWQQEKVFGENINAFAIGAVSVVIVFVFSYICHFLLAPGRIYAEQLSKIIELTERKKTQLESNQIADKLHIFYTEGLQLATEWQANRTVDRNNFSEQRDDFLSRVKKEMEDNKIPENVIYDFLNPSYPTSSPSQNFAGMISHLSVIIKNLKQS